MKNKPKFEAYNLVDEMMVAGTLSEKQAELLKNAMTKTIKIRCYYKNQIASVTICDDLVKVSGEYGLKSIKGNEVIIQEK